MNVKKVLLVLSVPVVSMFFSSCQVNWFDTHFDVPWWAIVFPTTTFIIVVWGIAGKYISSKKYICPKCGKSFHPKFWASVFSIHINDDRVFKCPHCGNKGFCHLSRD